MSSSAHEAHSLLLKQQNPANSFLPPTALSPFASFTSSFLLTLFSTLNPFRSPLSLTLPTAPD